MSGLLSIDCLSLAVSATAQAEREEVREVSLELERGETLALVGDRGAGRSLLLGALTGGLPKGTRLLNGDVRIDPGTSYERNLLRLPARAWSDLCRTRITLLSRDITGQWNPGRTLRQHLRETMDLAGRARDPGGEANWLPSLCEAGLIEPESLLGRYPGELPEGVLQRFAIAMALLKGADLWIADEPTAELDATGEDQILQILRELCQRHAFGLLVATPHIGVIGRLADRVAVLFEGAIVETGPVAEVLRNPRHRYTQALLDCLPRLGEHRTRLGEMDRVAEREAIGGAETG